MLDLLLVITAHGRKYTLNPHNLRGLEGLGDAVAVRVQIMVLIRDLIDN